MRTMFLKLFLWFWLAMTLSALLSFLLAFNMRLGPLHAEFEHRFDAERDRILTQAIEMYGRTAAAIFERYGRGADMDIAGRVGPPGMRGYLFAADGVPLSGKAPPPVKDAVRRLLTSGRNKVTGMGDRGLAATAVRVWSPMGRLYVAAAEGMPAPPPRPREPRLGFFPFPPDFWFRFGVSFVVGGLVCYVLAWRLTTPVRQLRAATQRLATGDLATRVTIRGKGRGDEVTDLVRDFNRMAERIERLVTAQKQLVRDVSHELRSPLARLNVALELARRESPQAAAAPLERIGQEAERLNVMIGELLTLSMLESGSEKLESKPFDLAELVNEVVRDADFEATSRERRVFCASSPFLMLSGNREMLRRAMENVVRNGVRYTAPGTAVEVSLERDPPDHAVIRVRDHGSGVPEEALSEIFRPFFRVAEARDRQSGNTGIGLAITERTVKLHNGTVTARNPSGGGLEVEIRLLSS